MAAKKVIISTKEQEVKYRLPQKTITLPEISISEREEFGQNHTAQDVTSSAAGRRITPKSLWKSKSFVHTSLINSLLRENANSPPTDESMTAEHLKAVDAAMKSVKPHGNPWTNRHQQCHPTISVIDMSDCFNSSSQPHQ